MRQGLMWRRFGGCCATTPFRFVAGGSKNEQRKAEVSWIQSGNELDPRNHGGGHSPFVFSVSSVDQTRIAGSPRPKSGHPTRCIWTRLRSRRLQFLHIAPWKSTSARPFRNAAISSANTASAKSQIRVGEQTAHFRWYAPRLECRGNEITPPDGWGRRSPRHSNWTGVFESTDRRCGVSGCGNCRTEFRNFRAPSRKAHRGA
jgi:hypothetical protein